MCGDVLAIFYLYSGLVYIPIHLLCLSIRVKLLQRILGFLNFALQLFPLGRSFIRPWYELASNFASSRVKLDPSPLAHLRDVFFKGPLFAFWLSGVTQPSLPCFVDATPSRVAGIAGQGGFDFSFPVPRPIFEEEFLASFYGIGTYRPISNNIHLIGDNLGVETLRKTASLTKNKLNFSKFR